MKSTGMLAIAVCVFGASAAFGQIQPPAGKTTGPGMQAPADAREPEVLRTCKVPPPARGGRAGGAGGRGGPNAAQTEGFPRDYTVTEITGVIAAGQKWQQVWEVNGNNADGIIATKDGGILLAQNDDSDVIKLDRNGKATVAYTNTNTGGALAVNSKGVLFIVNRGLNESIDELAPQRRMLANKFNGDPIDCLGGVLNDLAADSKGGAYFTMGGVFYADSKGLITRYGENLATNGIVLTADEKHVIVTNQGKLAEFDVQPDGSLTNQREFAKLVGGIGGDGSTFDAAGRLYVTTPSSIQVFSSEGAFLGQIPTPRIFHTVTISGANRKTLYAAARTGPKDYVYSIELIAQGPKDRGK